MSQVPSRFRAGLLECVAHVQSMPFSWPAPPEAAWTREAGTGTCAWKHALLAEDLAAVGLRCRPFLMVGPLVPEVWPDLLAEGGDLQEVHECLTVETSWAGPLLVDVTWHPAAIRGGLSGTLNWSGDHDMQPALAPVSCYAVSRRHLRAQKEKLRDRLYTSAQRLRRDALLGHGWPPSREHGRPSGIGVGGTLVVESGRAEQPVRRDAGPLAPVELDVCYSLGV